MAGGARDRPDQRRRQLRPAHARPGDPRRRCPAPRAHRDAPADRRARLARRRARPAPARLRPPAVARARLLRPPADRPAHVARDGRPAVRALLPRLRAHLHDAVRADDRARRGGDVRDRRGARRGVADPRAARHLRRRALRAPRAPGAAGGPATDRRADGRRRGERRRRARRQVLRARGPPARALPLPRRARVRPGDGVHAPAGLLQPVHRLPAAARARGDPLLRRPPGHRRQPDHRRVHRLLRLSADAARADAHARHLARAGPARDRRRRAAVRDPRPRARASPRRPARPGCPMATATSSCAT